MAFIERKGPTIRIGHTKITASRWPWQKRSGQALLSDPKTEKAGTKYGWRGTPGMGRFGGGWNWCFGFRLSAGSLYIELLIGAITVSRLKRLKCIHCGVGLGEYHNPACIKFNPRWPDDSWMNKEDGR